MKITGLIIAMIMAVGITIVLSNCSIKQPEKKESIIALAEVPKVVIAATSKIIEKIKLTTLKVEKTEETAVYKIKGL